MEGTGLMIDVPNRDPLHHAQSLLDGNSLIDLRTVTVDRDGDRLVLHGRVCSFYAKQVAQETIRPAADGMILDNRLQVVADDRP
jgi:hypothetical protein